MFKGFPGYALLLLSFVLSVICFLYINVYVWIIFPAVLSALLFVFQLLMMIKSSKLDPSLKKDVYILSAMLTAVVVSNILWVYVFSWFRYFASVSAVAFLYVLFTKLSCRNARTYAKVTNRNHCEAEAIGKPDGVYTVKKNIALFLVPVILALTACNDRKDYFALSNQNINVGLESPLTACTSAYPGFINLDYAFNFTLSPEYPKVTPFPLVAQYTCENSGSFKLSMGNKRYSPDDTIMFNALSKKMMLNVSKPGTYRFLIQFFKENKREEILGKYELTFVIGTPDLNMYIVRDGKRVENLNETENFLEFEGSFIVRVNSEKEDLNKGRLTLTAGITGSSVQVKNWKDRETKISQSDDLPQSVDFLVEYKNIQTGKTKFVFTAQSQNSSAVLRDSMNIQESRPGSLHLNTVYHQEKNYFSREQLWAGQTDSVEYLITPDPKAISDLYKIKFEMSDPAGLWLFNTGNPEKQKSDRQYEPNKWYDFSDKMTGKLYYVFPVPTNCSDTVFISMQNGETGPIQKYRLFVSCKQSSDYTFDVTFQPDPVDGFDEIKFSDLLNNVALHTLLFFPLRMKILLRSSIIFFHGRV